MARHPDYWRQYRADHLEYAEKNRGRQRAKSPTPNTAKPKKIPGVTPEQMAIMEREISNVENQFKLLEQSYGQDILNLVLARGYLTKLIGNEAVIRFLTQKHADFLNEFSNIVNTTSLDK